MSTTDKTSLPKHADAKAPSPLAPAVSSKRFLTEHEVAERLNISVQFLRKLRYERKPPHYCKFGNRVRYPLEEIARYEAAALQTQEAPPSRLPADGGPR